MRIQTEQIEKSVGRAHPDASLGKHCSGARSLGGTRQHADDGRLQSAQPVTGTGGAHQLDTVLLKVASSCNLDCSYCYVYHMGDETWRDQPKRMPDTVLEQVAKGLEEQLRLQAAPFSVVLHVGEPLLLGAKRLEFFCSTLCRALPASLRHPCSDQWRLARRCDP